VHFCIIEPPPSSLMQFGTVSVRNYTRAPRGLPRLQKCTLTAARPLTSPTQRS
jgi:hypothetical protein